MLRSTFLECMPTSTIGVPEREVVKRLENIVPNKATRIGPAIYTRENVAPTLKMGVRRRKYIRPDHFSLIVDANQYVFSVLVVMFWRLV